MSAAVSEVMRDVVSGACASRIVSCVMRTAPPLLPLFRSDHQGRLLALVLFDADRELSVAELARRLGVNHATVSREVDRLEGAGIVTSRRLGQLRLVRAAPESPVAAEVRSLALKAFGPAYVIADAIGEMPGIVGAWIYGSYAERAHGTVGPPPQDLDVLVVGAPDRDALYRAARSAGEQLGREVNVTVRSVGEWEEPTGFLRAVKEGPLVDVLAGGG